MGRAFAERTEVARRANEMSAEYPAPDAVDVNPGGQGFGIGDDGVGKFAAAAAIAERPRLAPGKHAREMPGHEFSRPRRVAANEYRQVAVKAGAILHTGP